MFTSSIIAILTISRAIIQSCISAAGWFSKETELSWISNYCISLIKIHSKLKTVSRSQAIVYGRTNAQTKDTTPGHKLFWPLASRTKMALDKKFHEFLQCFKVYDKQEGQMAL